jgi:tRNA(His) 5'-end guanylyltransferase
MTLPFDEHFTTAMKKTAEECFDYFNFFLGFVGSDEITYAIRPLTEEQIEKKGTLAFNGRVEKMVSLLAGRVSTTFFIELTKLEGF